MTTRTCGSARKDPRIIALVSDQGAIVTLNGGETWSSWFNQPTAQLYPRQRHADLSRTGSAPASRKAARCASPAAATTARSPSATGIRSAAIEYGYVAPDPLDPDVIYGAGRNEVSKFHISTGQVQNVTPIPVRGPDVRVDRTQPLAVLAARSAHPVTTRPTVSTGPATAVSTWQTISPDLAREAGALPASVGALHPPGARRNSAASSTRSDSRRAIATPCGPAPMTAWCG